MFAQQQQQHPLVAADTGWTNSAGSETRALYIRGDVPARPHQSNEHGDGGGGGGGAQSPRFTARCQLDLHTGALLYDASDAGHDVCPFSVRWSAGDAPWSSSSGTAPPHELHVSGPVRVIVAQHSPSPLIAAPALRKLCLSDGAQFVLLEPTAFTALPWHIAELHVHLARNSSAWLGGMSVGSLYLDVRDNSAVHNVNPLTLHVRELQHSSFVKLAASTQSPRRHGGGGDSTTATMAPPTTSLWTEQDDADFGMHVDSLVTLYKTVVTPRRRRASAGSATAPAAPPNYRHSAPALGGQQQAMAARMCEPGQCLMCLVPGSASVMANPCGCYTLCVDCARLHGRTAASQWQLCPYCKRKLESLTLCPQ